jgi:hypothetical protein
MREATFDFVGAVLFLNWIFVDVGLHLSINA